MWPLTAKGGYDGEYMANIKNTIGKKIGLISLDKIFTILITVSGERI